MSATAVPDMTGPGKPVPTAGVTAHPVDSAAQRDADQQVLVEAFAHQGKMIGGQLKKVSEDAFKLVTLGRARPGARLIVAFADDVAAKSFLGRSWKAEARRLWGVEVLVAELNDDVCDGIRAAQVRQFR